MMIQGHSPSVRQGGFGRRALGTRVAFPRFHHLPSP